MLINGTDPEETRIAVLTGDRLDEYYLERPSRETLVGNLYKGVVTSTHAALQAAFVNIGLPKNAFMHVTETRGEGEGPPPPPGRRPPRGGPKRPPRLIQNLLKVGQEVIVEVTRDAFGEKGASVTMEISLPGRFLVLTPLTPRIGISKRIAGDKARRDLRTMLDALAPPKEIGYIIRTAGSDMDPEDLKKDLEYLVRLWETVSRRAKETPGPVLLYQESDLVIRAIRDVFSREMEEILIDDPGVHQRVVEFFRAAMPRHEGRVRLYDGAEPVFRRFGVEAQIAQIYARTVELPCGGSIVIEHTEAMTTIDVNSGRLMRTGSPEETAFQADLEAASAIARQLRLRDLGGVVVVDFIDVRHERHRRALDKAVRDAIRSDRSQISASRMHDSCLVQIIREKVRPSPETLSTRECPRCRGEGTVPSPESAALAVLRDCRGRLARADVAALELRVSTDIAAYLDRAKQAHIADLQARLRKTIRVVPVPELMPEQFEIRATGLHGEPVA
jgi:ribonuclease E